MPRPTKLNAKRAQQICDYVAQGHPREVAAQACGIVSTTLYRWMKRGELRRVLQGIKKGGPRGGAGVLAADQRGSSERRLARGSLDARAALSREVGQAAGSAQRERGSADGAIQGVRAVGC